MSDCNYGVGQHVGIPAFGGACAEILRKEPFGSGWQLWVRLPSGHETSVSCDSVGPCMRIAAAPELAGLRGLDGGEGAGAAQRPPTFEEIDSHIQRSELFNLHEPGEERPAELAGSRRPEDPLREIDRAFRMIQPVLRALVDAPFLRGGWRQALSIYLRVMESQLGTEMEPPPGS